MLSRLLCRYQAIRRRRQATHRLVLEPFERRDLLAVDFMNPLDSLDVSDDGNVSPIDALLVINEINTRGARQLPPTRPPELNLVDVSGDRYVSPIDALLVINQLNQKPLTGLSRSLLDASGLSAEETMRIATGIPAGVRTYTLSINADFGQPSPAATVVDSFMIYLVTSDRTHDTVVDQGIPGSPIFVMNGRDVQTTPGLTHFDGKQLSIDMANISLDSAVLKLQLLNQDPAIASRVTVTPQANAIDPESTPPPRFSADRLVASLGGAANADELSPRDDVEAQVSAIQFDRTTGNYEADLQVVNHGEPIGRSTIVTFPGLPASVVLANASGVTTTGEPYLNLKNAINSGGLGSNDQSMIVRLIINNPSNLAFSLKPQVYSGTGNRAPILNSVPPISMKPGERFAFSLDASDPDGDPIRYSITNTGPLPALSITGNEIVISPTASQIGAYQLNVTASDGVLSDSRTVSVTVTADPVTSTRLSGKILTVSGAPIVGMRVEVGSIQALTQSDGSFLIDLGTLPVSDTLRVRADLFAGNLPFIAEKIPLLLEHELYPGLNNHILRPIYLPALNSGIAITPTRDQTISQQLQENEAAAAVQVKAGTLLTQQGTLFTGNLSITEVPANRTPAAIPNNLVVDTVVTIQPGEMTFATPAPLSLPNRTGFPADTDLDLWSINPTTGSFEIAGKGRVSPDGSKINTIEGGIRFSSWHFFAPPPTINPQDETYKPAKCSAPTPTICASSQVVAYSGVYLEDHTTPSYSSVGVDRAVTLVYSSKRSNPENVIRFNTDLPTWFDKSGASGDHIGINVVVKHGPTQYGYPRSGSTSSNKIVIKTGNVEDSDRVAAGVQLDMDDMPDGLYTYSADLGAYRGDGSQTTASLLPLTGQLVKVDSRTSSFGAGWGVAGLQSLLVSPDEGTVIVVDGNGSELLFERTSSGSYTSPTGDYSVLSQVNADTFQRRMKDGTVYRFDASRKLESVTDRNGNRTTYAYDGNSRLVKITDPAGLATTLSYSNGKLTAIHLPDGRTTQFAIDAKGDLTQIIDPDGSTRHFAYDSSHRLVSELTPLGAKETTEYDALGRVRKVTRADGSVMQFTPAETKGILPYIARTLTALKIPNATNSGITQVVMPSGNVVTSKVNRDGLILSTSDQFGTRVTYTYDDSARITSSTTSTGVTTNYTYDSLGNPVAVRDSVTSFAALFPAAQSKAPDGLTFPGRIIYPDLNTIDIATGEVTEDADVDVVVVGNKSVNNSVVGVIATLPGDGSGNFGDAIESDIVGTGVYSPSLVDFNGDGRLDLVVGAFDFFRTQFRLFTSSTDGKFHQVQQIDLGSNTEGFYMARTGDVTGDGKPDVIAFRPDGANAAVLINDGELRFTRILDLSIPVPVSDLALADVNADGMDDIVVRSNPTKKLIVFTASGSGLFNASQSIDFTSSPDAMAIADYNRDAVPDIAVVSGTDLHIFNGRATGGFALHQTQALGIGASLLSAIDLGSDGSLDLVLQRATNGSHDGLATLRNLGSSFAVPEFVNVGRYSTSQHVADVNHDALPDLIRRNVDQGIQLVLQQTSGILTTAAEIDVDFENGVVASGDFNGDGFADITVTGSTSTRMSLGNGLGQFSEARILRASTGGYVAAANFNGDDRDELVVAEPSTLIVFYFNADGTVKSTTSFERELGQSGLRPIEIGDFNKDGRDDFAFSGRVDALGYSAVDVYLSQEDGTFTKQRYLQENGSSLYVYAGDFDGDGDKDLLYTGATGIGNSQPIYANMLWNDGTGSFANSSRVTFPSVQANDYRLAVADITHDGADDVVILVGSELFNLTSQRDGSFSLIQSEQFAGWTPTSPSIEDVNSDGLPDLITADGQLPNNHTISVLLGKGNGHFDSRVAFDIGFRSVLFTIADLDLDGSPDIIANKHIDQRPHGLAVLGLPQVPALKQELTQTFAFETGFSQLQGATDEMGRIARYQIDPNNGNLLSITRPLGFHESMTYTPLGQIDTHSNALGHVTDYDYDNLGRLLNVTAAKGTPDQLSISYAYDAVGNVSALTDANGNTTRFQYDGTRRLVKQTDALGGVTAYTRDAAGNVLTVTDALGGITRYTYDAMSRLTSLTDPLGQVTKYSYDVAGNLSAVTDPLNKVSRSIYDVAGRLIRSIDPSGGATAFTYDGNDNLLSVTDPIGNLTRYFYDERNRVVREQDPLLQSTFYLYDGSDNLIAKRDRNDRQTRYTYDALDRQVEERWLMDGGQAANTISRSFDLNSNLLSIADDSSKLTFTYDSLDRVKTASNSGTPGQPEVLLSYVYDGSNLAATSDTIAGVSGATVTNAYDELNRVKAIVQTGSSTATKRVDYTWNALGQYTGIARSNNADGSQAIITTVLSYDDAHRLTLIDHESGRGTSYASFGYGYDAASRINQIVENGNPIDYSYDDRDQLISANYADATRTDENFAFDANANRLQSSAHGSAYRTGPGNRLLTDGVYNYEYDKEGNLSKRIEISTANIREFAWDLRNRLASVTDKNAAGVLPQVVTFTYDAFDRRISKSVDTTPNDAIDAAIERYVYDGDDIILDFIDADGSGSAIAIQTARYLRGPGIDSLLAVESNSQTLWVLQDQLGSTRAIVDQSANLIQTIHYDAFGKALLDGQALTRYLFTGREADTQTGLHYYRARYYDPEIGQFVSEDPIGFGGGSFNTRSYVDNLPISFIDPYGLKSYQALMDGLVDDYYLVKEQHYDRNRDNDPPLSEAEAKRRKWRPAPDSQSKYHQHGPFGAGNRKYWSPDGTMEGVYDPCGQLVTSPQNQGTANWGPDPLSWDHFALDVVPYWLWGNTEKKDTPVLDRIFGP